MKKKWKIAILIIIILAILLSFFGVQFIKNARQDRTWPFNSGIQLPPIFKYYAYKYTNPDSLKIKTHYYEIATEYVSIPDKEAIGGGGGINFIDEQNLLITLNNGNNWTLNLPTKTFRKGTDIFTNKFLSIRDINIFPQRKEIALLVGEYNKSKCIVMKLKIYNFNFLEKKLDIVNEKTIWKSEEMCEDSSPYISNGGGRVVCYKNSYFISLDFLAGNFIIHFPKIQIAHLEKL